MEENQAFECESCNFNFDPEQNQTAETPAADITLYSTNCPKCKVIEAKLKQLNLDFTVISDLDTVLAFGTSHNILSAPILVAQGEIMDFTRALNYLREVRK